MKMTSDLMNKNLSSIKNHFVPSAVTAAVALAVAIPLTAALSSGTASQVSAQPMSNSSNPVCGTASTEPTNSVSTAFHFVPQPGNNTITNSGNSGGGTGSTNSGSQNTGATTATGGLVGVAVPVAVNALNNDLNNNSVSVDTGAVSASTATLTNVLSGAANTLTL